MSRDSSTKPPIRSPRLARTAIHITLSTIFMIGSIALSSLIEQRNATALLTSIKAIFRSDETIGNTALISRRLADLESLGIIECVTLVSPTLGEIYNTTFKDLCSVRESKLSPSVWTDGDIRAISGEPFQIRFKSSAKGIYLLYLNLLRLTGLFLVNGALLWYWSRLDAKARALAKEEDNNRILEIRIKEQAELIADMKIESAVQRSLSTVATQVSHDVRSPLSALNMVVRTLDGIPDDKKQLLERALNRINEITNDLLNRHKQNPQTGSNVSTLTLHSKPVATLLAEVFEEKRVAFVDQLGVDLRLDLSGPQEAQVLVNDKELTRALSNLINNAIESLEGSGTVTLALRSTMKEVAIIVSDNGHGIPEELLSRLGKERVTYGKEHTESGSGIGVLHARSAVEAMGGKFSIQSRVGVGTIISMKFPRTDLAGGT